MVGHFHCREHIVAKAGSQVCFELIAECRKSVVNVHLVNSSWLSQAEVVHEEAGSVENRLVVQWSLDYCAVSLFDEFAHVVVRLVDFSKFCVLFKSLEVLFVVFCGLASYFRNKR
jgi:hypothetical protein